MVQDSDPYDVVVVGAGVVGIIVAAKIAQKGVHLRTKGRLRVALMERGPYLKGTPRPGYGHPLRRRMFTNVMSEFREGRRYLMEVPQGPGGTYGYPIPAASTVGVVPFTTEPKPGILIPWTTWPGRTRRGSIGPKPECSPPARKSTACQASMNDPASWWVNSAWNLVRREGISVSRSIPPTWPSATALFVRPPQPLHPSAHLLEPSLAGLWSVFCHARRRELTPTTCTKERFCNTSSPDEFSRA